MLGPERRPAGEQLVENRAEAVDIDGRRQHLFRPRLFGRHVARRADDGAGLRLPRVAFHALGQAEIRDVRLAVLRPAECCRA